MYACDPWPPLLPPLVPGLEPELLPPWMSPNSESPPMSDSAINAGEEGMDCDLLYPVVQLVEGDSSTSSSPTKRKRRYKRRVVAYSDSDSAPEMPRQRKPRRKKMKAEPVEWTKDKGRRMRRARTILKAHAVVATMARRLRSRKTGSASHVTAGLGFSDDDLSGAGSESSVHIENSGEDEPLLPIPVIPVIPGGKGALRHHTYCRPAWEADFAPSILRQHLLTRNITCQKVVVTLDIPRHSQPSRPHVSKPQVSLSGNTGDRVTWSVTRPLCTPAVVPEQPPDQAICVIESVQSLQVIEKEDEKDSLCVISKVESLSESTEQTKKSPVPSTTSNRTLVLPIGPKPIAVLPPGAKPIVLPAGARPITVLPAGAKLPGTLTPVAAPSANIVRVVKLQPGRPPAEAKLKPRIITPTSVAGPAPVLPTVRVRSANPQGRVAVPIPLPQLQTHEGYTAFFQSVKKQLRSNGCGPSQGLPLGWHLNPGGEGRIELLFIRNRKVQKALVIHSDFTYTVYAHSKPVSRGNPIYADIGKNRLLGVWMIRKAVSTIDRYQVCPGAKCNSAGTRSTKAYVTSDMSKILVSEGNFSDYDAKGVLYESALRSVNCHLLLRRSAEVCQYCWQCRERLKEPESGSSSKSSTKTHDTERLEEPKSPPHTVTSDNSNANDESKS